MSTNSFATLPNAASSKRNLPSNPAGFIVDFLRVAQDLHDQYIARANAWHSAEDPHSWTLRIIHSQSSKYFGSQALQRALPVQLQCPTRWRIAARSHTAQDQSRDVAYQARFNLAPESRRTRLQQLCKTEPLLIHHKFLIASIASSRNQLPDSLQIRHIEIPRKYKPRWWGAMPEGWRNNWSFSS